MSALGDRPWARIYRPFAYDSLAKWSAPIQGPLIEERDAYAAHVLAYPDLEPSVAALPETDWSVVVYGTGSQNTHVVARTQEEAERLAIEGLRDGGLTFDETMWGILEAEAETESGG